MINYWFDLLNYIFLLWIMYYLSNFVSQKIMPFLLSAEIYEFKHIRNDIVRFVSSTSIGGVVAYCDSATPDP